MAEVRDWATLGRIRAAGRLPGLRAMTTAAVSSTPAVTDLFGLVASVLAAIVFMLAAVPLCVGITGLVRRRRGDRAAGPPAAATGPRAAGIDDEGVA